MPTLIRSQVTLSVGRLEVSFEENRALTLEDIPEVFPGAAALLGHDPDPTAIADEVCDILREGCSLRGSHEHLFLLLYFNRVIERLKSEPSLRNIMLPLPRARFCLAGGQKSVAVDFAFWTGKQFVAVFIHESPFDEHGRKEQALLKVWGFKVFCLTADEFEARGLLGKTGVKILDVLQLR